MDRHEEIDLLELQSQEWSRGNRTSLEDLIKKFPRLKSDAELLLDLIYNEVLLREQAQERPTAEDYASRFPQLAAQLSRQFEVHKALESSNTSFGGVHSPIPETIIAGRYESTRFHKEGGLGFVFLAHDRELNRAVALKCMKRKGELNEPLVRRFLQEAEITSQLEHPSIVPVHGSGVTSDGRPFYAMRFIDGETFESASKKLHSQGDIFHKGVAEFRRLLRALVQVCEAVAYAHSKRIIHRDLKPANIMLGAYGEALVLDWGLAKSLDQEESAELQSEHLNASRAKDETLANYNAKSETPPAELTITGKAKGSPAFMSPEQARGDWPQVGVASDVYSLGATLFFLLTGKLAFSATTSQGVLKQVGAGEFQPPRSFDARVPAALSAITCKAMALRPEDRYATTKELAKELDLWMADEPVAAYPESATARIWRWARRHRTLMATGVMGLIIASLGLATGAWRANIANQALSKANEQESEQRALANQRFSDALDDQVRLVTDIQTELSKAAGTRAIREKLVKEAMEKLQKLITSASGVQDAEMAMISAHYALGTLYEEVDLDLVKADAELKIALDNVSALEAKEPSQAALRDLHFQCLLRRFYIQINRGQIAEAETTLGEAESLLPKDKRDFEHTTAKAASARARLAQTKGDYPSAIKELQRVRDFWQSQSPSNERTLQLSYAHAHLGELQYFSGKYAESVDEEAIALTFRRELIKQEPSNILHQLRAAAISENLGVYELARNQHAAAEKHFDESIRLAQAVVAKDPENTAAKLQLADAQSTQSGLLADRGKLNDALELIESAKAISNALLAMDKNSFQGRANLVSLLIREGRIRQTQEKIKEAANAFEQASQIQRELLTIASDRTHSHFELARILRDLAELRLSYLKEIEGGFQAFQEAQAELDLLAKLDATNIQWQEIRICNLMDVARWKAIQALPGVEEAVDKGMKEIAALPEAVQKSPQILSQIAFFKKILAEEFISKKNFDAAIKVLDEEIAILEDLKSKMPNEPFVWRHLRTLYGQAARVCDAKSDPEGAIEAMRKAVDSGRELETRFPDYDRQNQYLPEKLEQLADRLVFTEPLEALKLLEEAVSRYDQIVPEVAARFQFQIQLGVKRLKLADLSELMSGDDEATIRRYRSAAEHFAHCPAENPQQTAVAAAFQAWSRRSECEKLATSGAFAEAAKAHEQAVQALTAADPKQLESLPLGKDAIEWRNDYEGLFEKLPTVAESHEAIEMLPKPQRLLALQSRVGKLVSRGELDEAAKSIDWLAENGSDLASITYKAAKMYATLYAKSKSLESKYRDRALELLSIAIKQGWFKEPGNKALSRLAPEFRGFHDTPEFKRLFEAE